MWDERNCQSFETRGFEPGFSWLTARRSSHRASLHEDHESKTTRLHIINKITRLHIINKMLPPVCHIGKAGAVKNLLWNNEHGHYKIHQNKCSTEKIITVLANKARTISVSVLANTSPSIYSLARYSTQIMHLVCTYICCSTTQ